MTEPMKLTAEEIIKIIDEEIQVAKAEIEEQGAQICTTYDLSADMSNDDYSKLHYAIEGQQYRHNRILHLVTLKNIIEAAEEMKQHEQVMNHA